MNPSNTVRTGALVSGALALALTAGSAFAQQGATPSTPQPTAEQRRQAGAAFDQGMSARASRDFTSAANFFETADRLAPSAQALGNAIEAHRQIRTAQHNARAATLALRMLARHSSDARLSAYANRIIEDLAPGLERVTVTCQSCDLEVDGALASYTDFFVEPGAHTLVASWSNNRTRRHEFTAEANGTEDVTLEPPAEQVATPPPGPARPPEGSDELPPGMRRPGQTGPTTGPGDTERPRETQTPATTGRGGLPPWVFVTGAAATVVLGGVLIWSGLDALAGVPFYERDPTPEALADGEGRELRTNILIGATAAVGAFTLTTLFFTRWGGGRVEAAPAVNSTTGMAPGLTLRGRF